MIDICGIIAEVSEAVTTKPRNGSQKVRRIVTLVDDTGYSICLTLWASIVDRLTSADLHKVVAIKNARISDYLGKSLNASDDHASLFIQHEHERCDQLRDWFSREPFDLASCIRLTQHKQSEQDESVNRASL
jgi:hypothetical protein